MNSNTTAAEDLKTLFTELAAARYPGGLTDLNVAQFLCQRMTPSEEKYVEELMAQHPEFRAEIEERRNVCTELFDPKTLSVSEREVFQRLNLPQPVSPDLRSLVGQLTEWLEEGIRRIRTDIRDTAQAVRDLIPSGPIEGFFTPPKQHHNDSASLVLEPTVGGGMRFEIKSAVPSDEHARFELAIGSWTTEFQLEAKVPGSSIFLGAVEVSGKDLRKFQAGSTVRIRPVASKV